MPNEPYVEQIMVADGDGDNPDVEEVKYETVHDGGGGGGTNLDSLPDSTNDISDTDLIVSKENDGWVKKTALKIWTYVKTKLGISDQGSTGKYLDEQGNFTTPPNTTYGVVSKTADGLAPQLPNETTTTKYLRQDGSWSVPPDNNTTYAAMSSSELSTGTATTLRTMRADYAKDGIKQLMLDMCYPVGSIYISTKNVSPATFLGGTWVSKSGYMLRGATSSVTFNSDTNDGGADSVTVSSVASHNHTQDSHNHTQDSHNHTQDAHSHTLRARLLNGNSGTTSYGHTYYANQVGLEANFSGNKTSMGSGNQPASVLNATATNQAKTATNQAKTATNQAKGANYSVATLPKYKNVYMWERTA